MTGFKATKRTKGADMNVSRVGMTNYNANFCGIKKNKVNHSNYGAGENVPQPVPEKKEQPAVTWHNYGGDAYPAAQKQEPKEEPKDDRRFNKF